MVERDVEAVARLRLAAFFEDTGRTLEEDVTGLRQLLSDDGFEAAFVARYQGRSIGSCLLARHEIDPAYDLAPWLAGLIVDDGHRGRGVGTALVRAIEARAASSSIEMLHLHTWEARSFYEALG